MLSIFFRVMFIRWSIAVCAVAVMGGGSAYGQVVTVSPDTVPAAKRDDHIRRVRQPVQTGFYLDGNFFAACPSLNGYANCHDPTVRNRHLPGNR